MCVLDRLEVSDRALKRAQYEAFDFRLTPDGVEVRNGSHADPSEHVYTVTVADGVPATCTCPADDHYDGACKHRLAVAIREPVLEAAVVGAETDLVAAGDGVVTDGDDDGDDEDDGGAPDDDAGAPPVPVADGAGTVDGGVSGGAEPTEAARPDDCRCAGSTVDFPCWPCVRDGVQELPDTDDEQPDDGRDEPEGAS